MQVGDALGADMFAVDLGKFRVATYQGLSGLTFEQDATGVKTVTPEGSLVTRKIPGAKQLPDITLSRPMDASKVWVDWVVLTATNQDLDEARQNVGISLLDANKKPVLHVNLVNAWASSWKGPALSAGDASAGIETITLAYDDITIG
ncbi:MULTISPECIES: phage tail protein [Streptomyces]|uniref:Phage tail protein n=1 Tax=Streptomyces griseocarneus TaxID=51201 RepID=A0ABX7RNZ5_9ACTN|nr:MULTISPECIES: phage tail protein [Streptomyces]QSY49507.1 phage tail protein [Streptomyces griseocarneus]